MRYTALLPLLAAVVTALSPAQWRSQSIYQVLTDRFALTNGSTTAPCDLGNYCGGTWRGIINKLDYIQGMGFTAIWISPVVKNIDTPTPYGLPYHGYWAQDITSLNAHFGTDADLKALSAALHARGMYLMVDIVTNHMASNSAPAGVDYSKLTPFNKPSYYHPYCAIDYNNVTSIQQCWTGDAVVSLPDLRTEDAGVQSVFNNWITNFVKTFSVDGLRIDSAQQVNKQFYPSFVSAAGVYAVGEVFNGNPSFLCDYQTVMPAVLNYASYFWIQRAFTSTSATMDELVGGIQTLASACSDTTLLGNFVDNHDNPRFASLTSDASLIKNAIAYSIFSDGIPIVYYGLEQGFTGTADPANRQALWPSGFNTNADLYKYIRKLNSARKLVTTRDSSYVTSKVKVIQPNSKVLVTAKGSASWQVLSVFTNVGAGASTSFNLASTMTGLTANSKLVDLLTCNVYSADSTGNVAITISSGLPLILYRAEKLSGSDMCANAVGTVSTSSWSGTSTKASSSISSSTSPSCSITAPSCPASNGTTYTSGGKAFIVECGIDRPGNDLQMTYVAGLGQCIDRCAATSQCVDVSLSGAACYLKKAVGKPVYNTVQGARLASAATVGAASSTSSMTTVVKSSTTSSSTATTTKCSIATSVAITFKHNVTTSWGDTIKLVGSLSQLGSWNAAQGVAMSATQYPVWNATVSVAAGTYFEYKFVNVHSDGTITWEHDPNRSFTVPSSCATTAAIAGTWNMMGSSGTNGAWK